MQIKRTILQKLQTAYETAIAQRAAARLRGREMEDAYYARMMTQLKHRIAEETAKADA